jgi:endonuclease YncB( thermonuclease family)
VETINSRINQLLNQDVKELKGINGRLLGYMYQEISTDMQQKGQTGPEGCGLDSKVFFKQMEEKVNSLAWDLDKDEYEVFVAYVKWYFSEDIKQGYLKGLEAYPW